MTPAQFYNLTEGHIEFNNAGEENTTTNSKKRVLNDPSRPDAVAEFQKLAATKLNR